MPPKGRTKAQTKKYTFLGKFSSNSKELTGFDQKIIEQKEIASVKEKELNYAIANNEKLTNEIKSLRLKNEQQSKLLYEISKEIHIKQKKLIFKKRQLTNLNYNNISDKNEVLKKRKIYLNNKFSITHNTSKRRKLNPTTKQIKPKAKSIRCNETMQLCMAVHGASELNKKPALTGLVQTLSSKFSTQEIVDTVFASKTSVTNLIKDQNLKRWMTTFYLSEENLLRSLNTYYSHNVMGKKKYINIRKANKTTSFEKVRLVNFVPYKNLADKINSIDIGTVIDINPSLTTSFTTENEAKQGMYRPCDEFALTLAKHYLTVNQFRNDKLKTIDSFKKIDESSYMFIMSVGGDGAPLVGTVFLLSFLNVAKRIASSNENFLIFGANVDENSIVVRRFMLKLLSDIRFLESQVFDIVNNNGQQFKVEFRLGELPNDMKMLCFLAGELSNASYYFCTFGNVNQIDSSNYKKKLDNKDGWHEFSYKKRLTDASKVVEKKKSLEKSKLAETTKRTHITTFISQTLKSRQEEIPLVENFIDRAKCEPLHLKNNTVKEMFMKLLRLSYSESNIGNIKTFNQVTEEKLFFKFITFVRYSMGCNSLSSKVIQWVNENNGKVEKPFTFRFRGAESRAFLSHFPELIVLMLNSIESEQVVNRLHQLFYQSICLRKIISYSVRIEDFDLIKLQHLEQSCRHLFITSSLLEKKISPSLWALCNAVPFHAAKTLKDYGFGLGCNSMEGREQKHQRIVKYAHNTTYQCRWPYIFRHEFIQLIYLKENGFDQISYNTKNVSYMPVLVENSCQLCGLKYLNESKSCNICNSIYRKNVIDLISAHS